MNIASPLPLTVTLADLRFERRTLSQLGAPVASLAKQSMRAGLNVSTDARNTSQATTWDTIKNIIDASSHESVIIPMTHARWRRISEHAHRELCNLDPKRNVIFLHTDTDRTANVATAAQYLKRFSGIVCRISGGKIQDWLNQGDDKTGRSKPILEYHPRATSYVQKPTLRAAIADRVGVKGMVGNNPQYSKYIVSAFLLHSSRMGFRCLSEPHKTFLYPPTYAEFKDPIVAELFAVLSSASEEARKPQIESALSVLEHGSSIVIDGGFGYGKTSLAFQIAKRLQRQGRIIAHTDLRSYMDRDNRVQEAGWAETLLINSTPPELQEHLSTQRSLLIMDEFVARDEYRAPMNLALQKIKEISTFDTQVIFVRHQARETFTAIADLPTVAASALDTAAIGCFLATVQDATGITFCPDFADELYQATGGIPFFVLSALSWIISNGGSDVALPIESPKLDAWVLWIEGLMVSAPNWHSINIEACSDLARRVVSTQNFSAVFGIRTVEQLCRLVGDFGEPLDDPNCDWLLLQRPLEIGLVVCDPITMQPFIPGRVIRRLLKLFADDVKNVDRPSYAKGVAFEAVCNSRRWSPNVFSTQAL